MLSDIDEVLESLTYSYQSQKGKQIDVRIHHGNFYILDDMLALLTEISVEHLFAILNKKVLYGSIDLTLIVFKRGNYIWQN